MAWSTSTSSHWNGQDTQALFPVSHYGSYDLLPIESLLNAPNSLGRLMKWSVALEQYDIHYQPSTAIKAQILADFLAEFTIITNQPNGSSTANGNLFINGSSNSRRRRVWKFSIGFANTRMMNSRIGKYVQLSFGWRITISALHRPNFFVLGRSL